MGHAGAAVAACSSSTCLCEHKHEIQQLDNAAATQLTGIQCVQLV